MVYMIIAEDGVLSLAGQVSDKRTAGLGDKVKEKMLVLETS